MWYLKKFSTESDYQAFKRSMEYLEPNVSLITDNNKINYNPIIPISLGDIAYWNGWKVKTIAKDKWDSSLGTPIGVVVIPEGMLPDGKARMISLKDVDENGNASSSLNGIEWSVERTDTSLTRYTQVPITLDNKITSSSDSYGCLPSDKFSALASFADPKSFYNYDNYDRFIPSPYLGDDKTMNPDYSMDISGNNALSDFNGLQNTEVLVGLGSDYTAANAAWNYKDGVSDTQWYLPAMGELGFLMLRLNAINETISEVGEVVIDEERIWSSSECSNFTVYGLTCKNGYVQSYNKITINNIRPFGML